VGSNPAGRTNCLPRFEKKFRVALDWTLAVLFHKDLVQFQTLRTKGVSHEEPKPAGFRVTDQPGSTSRLRTRSSNSWQQVTMST
jgi:hypothetical protein